MQYRFVVVEQWYVVAQPIFSALSTAVAEQRRDCTARIANTMTCYRPIDPQFRQHLRPTQSPTGIVKNLYKESRDNRLIAPHTEIVKGWKGSPK